MATHPIARYFNRHTMFLALGILAGLCLAAAGIESNGPRTVTADRFEVTGPGGEVRASIAVTKDGAVRFSLFDQTGKERIALATSTERGPRITVFDAANHPRVLISQVGDGYELVFATEHSLPVGSWVQHAGSSGINISGTGGREAKLP